jgi:hypothetical protein
MTGGAGILLDLAEAGDGLPPAAAALAFLRRVHPDVPADAIENAALSQRDRALLDLRGRLFGPVLQAKASCGSCGTRVDLAFRREDVGLGAADVGFPPAPEGEFAGRRLRAVTAGDLAAAERARTPEIFSAVLAERAGARPGDDPDALSAALEGLDPLAAIPITIECPECGAENQREFDVARFVADEIAARAPRILQEVAEIARVFHWSEADILAMPPRRRAFYLAEARA